MICGATTLKAAPQTGNWFKAMIAATWKGSPSSAGCPAPPLLRRGNMCDWDADATVLFMSVGGALGASIPVGAVFVIGYLGDMDWDIVMESAQLCLLAFGVPFALYCLALLAAKPVGTLIGHTLMLFPA